MTSTQRSAIRGLVAVHFVLASAPLGAALLLGDLNDLRMLPFLWALSSIPFSQITLLSIWVGMVSTGKILPKILPAILATALLTVWITSGQVLGSTEPPITMVALFFQNLAIMLGIVAVLSVVMAGTSRLVGTIRFTKDTDLPSNEPRFHYSLFALLAISTATALVLSLVRMSRVEIASDLPQTVSYLLAIVVFALNTFAIIWATLGAGHVKRRLFGVFVIAMLLGLSMAIAVGNSPYSQPWWLFISTSLIVLVPTSITALTLLYLRRLGFRLISPPSETGSET